MYSDYFIDYVSIWSDPDAGYNVTKHRWINGVYFISTPHKRSGHSVYCSSDSKAIQLAIDLVKLDERIAKR